MTTIRTSVRARSGLAAIWRYIAADSPIAADRVAAALKQKIERLAEFPEIGPLRDDLLPGARLLVHGRYVVIYRFDGAADVVSILAVVDGTRDLSQLF